MISLQWLRRATVDPSTPHTVASGWPRLLCMQVSWCRCSTLNCINLGPCSARIRDGSGPRLVSGISFCSCWAVALGSCSVRRTLLGCSSSSKRVGHEELPGKSVASPPAGSNLLANTVANNLASWQLRMSCLRFNNDHSSHWSSQKIWAFWRRIPKRLRRGACWELSSFGGGLQRSAPLQVSTPTIFISGKISWTSWMRLPGKRCLCILILFCCTDN